MQTASQRILTAFFRNQSDAEDATRQLEDAGIPKNSIRLVAGKEPDGVAATDTDRTAGFWGSLADFLFPPEDHAVYAEGLRRGGFLVTVTDLDAAQHETALDILDDEGTIDVDEWADSWRAEGWTPGAGAESEQVANAARVRDAAEQNLPPFDAGRTTASDRVQGIRDPEVLGSRVRSYVYDRSEDNTLGEPPRA
jgi:hypothetical protein